MPYVKGTYMFHRHDLSDSGLSQDSGRPADIPDLLREQVMGEGNVYRTPAT